MKAKVSSPTEVAALDALHVKLERARAAWERGWRRMKRAIRQMEKADAAARRLTKRLNALQENEA